MTEGRRETELAGGRGLNQEAFEAGWVAILNSAIRTDEISRKVFKAGLRAYLEALPVATLPPPEPSGNTGEVEPLAWMGRFEHPDDESHEEWRLLKRSHAGMHTDWVEYALVPASSLQAAQREIERLTKEVERMAAHYFTPNGDNHHNAIKCPYCNPEKIDPAAERHARETAERQRDEAREAATEFDATIQRVEARCMACDGPVTPTLKEITEAELRELWLICERIRSLSTTTGGDNGPRS